jgi:hypothetical protein
VQIIQLTGQADRTLRWVPAPSSAAPEGLLTAGALEVNLQKEAAPWLLVVEGSRLGTLLVAHGRWLEAVAHDIRLVLRERSDLGDAAQQILAWPGGPDHAPYLLPALRGGTESRLWLLRTRDHRVIGSWPLASLKADGGLALKSLINNVLAMGRAAARPQSGAPR